MKSPLGMWSVHCRWPWKPPTIALWPSASSPKPMAASFGLPCIRSRPMSAIFTEISQSLSSWARERRFSGWLWSSPSAQCCLTQRIALANSRGS